MRASQAVSTYGAGALMDLLDEVRRYPGLRRHAQPRDFLHPRPVGHALLVKLTRIRMAVYKRRKERAQTLPNRTSLLGIKADIST
jgi:hypothetical protein